MLSHYFIKFGDDAFFQFLVHFCLFFDLGISPFLFVFLSTMYLFSSSV